MNLLLVLADDCTVWDTSVYGGQAVTPNLEKLAAERMTFTRCFQAAPMCSPTRHALCTSLYPVRSGAYPNHTYVRDGVESVAKWLADAGYRAHSRRRSGCGGTGRVRRRNATRRTREKRTTTSAPDAYSSSRRIVRKPYTPATELPSHARNSMVTWSPPSSAFAGSSYRTS